MKKLLTVLILSFCGLAYAQTPTPTLPDCSPPTTADIRSGTVGKDHWFYWWCRDPTKVWITWLGLLDSELRSYVQVGSVQMTSQIARGDITQSVPGGTIGAGTAKANPWNNVVIWGQSSDRTDTAHLKVAVLAAAATDAGKPAPGAPFTAPTSLPDLWSVTPNGASLTRKTNKIVNGTVTSTYGPAIKILTPCDCTTLHFAEGSMTQKCPLASATMNLAAVTDVISCIRVPR